MLAVVLIWRIEESIAQLVTCACAIVLLLIAIAVGYVCDRESMMVRHLCMLGSRSHQTLYVQTQTFYFTHIHHSDMCEMASTKSTALLRACVITSYVRNVIRQIINCQSCHVISGHFAKLNVQQHYAVVCIINIAPLVDSTAHDCTCMCRLWN